MATLKDNLISFWKLDESSGNATDSYSSNTLTNNNTVTFTTGKINNGADLESGSSQSLSITDASQSGLDISGDFTVSFWEKLESNPAASGNLFMFFSKWNNTGNQRSYQLFYIENSGNYDIQFSVSNDGTATTSVTWASVNLGTSAFKHIVIKYTASTHTSELFINGVSQGTKDSVRTSLYNSSSSFIVGARNDGFYFDGIMDEFGIWSRALSSTEISNLYNAGTGLSYPFTNSSGFLSLL